jgi:hypothetical protein
MNRCPSTAVRRPLSDNRCPTTAVRRPLSVDRCPATAVRQPLRGKPSAVSGLSDWR